MALPVFNQVVTALAVAGLGTVFVFLYFKYGEHIPQDSARIGEYSPQPSYTLQNRGIPMPNQSDRAKMHLALDQMVSGQITQEQFMSFTGVLMGLPEPEKAPVVMVKRGRVKGFKNQPKKTAGEGELTEEQKQTAKIMSSPPEKKAEKPSLI